MHHTLYKIPNEIAGVPTFGMGWLLAVWIVFSIGLMVYLFWRQGMTAETWGYVPLLLLVAAIIRWLLPAICEEQGLPIRSYGIMMLLAVAVGTGLAMWRARRVGLDPEIILSLAFWMFIPGILGARVFYVIEYWPTQYLPIFQQDGFAAGIKSVLNVAQGGLVVYGSFVGAILGLAIFVLKTRAPLMALLDLVAPSLALGQAIGRIGCLMNGCCFGGVCDHTWAITFPPDSPPYVSQVACGMMYGLRISEDPKVAPTVQWVDPDSPLAKAGAERGDRIASIDGQPIRNAGDAQYLFRKLFGEHKPVRIEVEGRKAVTLPVVSPPEHSLPVHPAQIYSAIDALLLCLLLLACDPFMRRDGQLFALLLTLHPISRFLLEMIRTDESAVFGTGLSISQNVSLIFLACAAALWFYIFRQPRGRVFVDRASSAT